MSHYYKTFHAVDHPLAIIQNDSLSIIEANSAFVRLTGYSREELMQISLQPIIEHCAGFRQLKNNIIRSFTLITKRKKRIPIWVELYELEPTKGKPKASAIAVQDLSSQIWLKRQCDGDQVLLSGIVDASFKIKLVVDAKKFSLLDGNDNSDDESILRLVSKEDWPKMEEAIREAVKLKQARTVTYRSSNLAAVVDMSLTFLPIFDGFGKVKEYAFVLHDILPVEETADSSMKLKILMAKRDINASQLAAATGISPQTISKLRNGKINRPQRLTAELIASELQVDLREIWKEVRN